jgi:esterase/lipase superfamily enzyme
MRAKSVYFLLLALAGFGCAGPPARQTPGTPPPVTTTQPADTVRLRSPQTGSLATARPADSTQLNRQALATLKKQAADKNLPPTQARQAAAALQSLRFNSRKLVRVFFATDRKVLPNPTATATFGPGRNDAKGVRYGSCLVTIPPRHSVGVLESPSLLKLEFHNNPQRDLFVTQTNLASAADFFRQLRQGVDSTARRSAFIFVHGYNVSFNDAARRTAQIACDMNFDGIPLFFSWPSRATLNGYAADEASIDWAGPHLKAFIRDFMRQSAAQNVYFIAHSMGNRGLTRAIAELVREEPAWAPRMKELILAAPDIDQDVFKQVIAPVLSARFPPVTLYVSSKDKALLASQALHHYPRAGESGRNRLVLRGIETIDASSVDLGLLGHGYVTEAQPVIKDLGRLLNYDTRAAQRHLLPRGQGATYWLIK